MYVKDFDRNGTPEQILCYTIDGQEYTFLAKDELERTLPVLKKAYLKYSEVAGKTVQYMFYDLFKDYREFKAEVLGSSCFINDGKGNFKRIDLPDELQLAPIFSFTKMNDLSSSVYMGLGNFYGVMPYEGRYDALYPTLFSYSKQNAAFNYTSLLPDINKEVRDSKWIRYKNGEKILIIASNNQALTFLKENK